MTVGLEQILASTRKRVAEARASTNIAQLERQAEGHIARGFRARLARFAETRPAIIAELKKASPSRGPIRGSYPVGSLTSQLAAAGAAALSVLTEPEFFSGSLADLCEASAASATASGELPCLRKDFILDEFQLVESKANFADAVLLIVTALNDSELKQLYTRAGQLGLDVLCEVHDEKELARALNCGCQMIGVNSRDLRTFQVDSEIPFRLTPKIPAGVFRIAESGIQSGEDIRKLRADGYQAFLIGEVLMKADDPGQALRRLIAESTAPPLGSAGVSSWRAGTKD